MVNGLGIVLVAAVIGISGPPQSPSETSLTVTFICPGVDCSTQTAVESDGAPIVGYTKTTVKNSTTIDGAFLNSAGGIDINLVTGFPSNVADRSLKLDLSLGTAAAGTPAACLPPSGQFAATSVDFRFNVPSAGSQGVMSLAVGSSASGDTGVVGIINFTLPSGAQGALFFNATQDPNWDGNVTISRLDARTFVVSSDSTVLFQCTPPTKGKAKTYDVGQYHMPFQLTAVLP